MAHSATIGLRKAAHRTNRKTDGPLSRALTKKQDKHDRTEYSSGRCRCKICTDDHNLSATESKARVLAGEDRHTVRARKIARAELMLQDGATYRETARSVRVDARTLSLILPGYKQNSLEWSGVRLSIIKVPHLAQMYREINS